MAFDIFLFIVGILDLLFTALKIAVPLFIIAIIALFARKKILEKFRLSWIQASLLTTYIFTLVILALIYLIPYYLGFADSSLAKQAAPEILALTPQEIAIAGLLTVFKIFSNALILTIIFLPLEFFAVFIQEKLKERKIHELIKLFACSYAVSLIAIIIVLIFPWIINGVIYLIYWG